jgi:hypothetical protein
VGAVLAFVIDYESQGVSIQSLGFLFVVGGLIGFFVTVGARLVRRLSRRGESPVAAGPRSNDDRREAVLREHK